MKRYFCGNVLICLLWCLTACNEQPKPVRSEIQLVKPVNIYPDISNQDTIFIDTIVQSEVEEEDTLPSLDSLINLLKQLNETFKSMGDTNQSFIEETDLTLFLGTKVDFAELAILRDTNDFVQIYADYFDGEPIGGKRFFVHKDELIGVEVIILVEKVSENGPVIVEENAYIFLYNKGQLCQAFDNSKNKIIDVDSISWAGEHMAQWNVISQHLNLASSL